MTVVPTERPTALTRRERRAAPARTEAKPEPGTPKWWMLALDAERRRRSADMQRYRDLAEGRHPWVVTGQQSAKFMRIAGLATTNLTGLAVEATAERMAVEGIRIGDEPDADKRVWDELWQRSDFDAGSQEAITAALVCGRSFISVTPPNLDGRVQLSYEDPQQVVVADGLDGVARAAWKVFTDPWTAETFGTLYLPQVVAKVKRVGKPRADGSSDWVLREDAERSVARNPFGRIPFFELQNRPLLSIASEVEALEVPQQRLNYIVYNTDSVGEFGAFRQKWATGIEVPRDPITDQPIAPYRASVTDMFVAEDTEARFGDFNPTDPDGYIKLGQDCAAHIARISRVPITYFLSNVANLSAEALALLVSGLVLKCGRRVKSYEPAFENAVRLALAATGDRRAEVANIEVKWAAMETRSMAQAADAAVKLTQGDNPVITPQTAQEEFLGMSQTERDRDQAWRDQNRAGDPLAQLTNVLDGQAAGGEDDPAEVKARADAMGVLIRSGVEPADAAAQVGLTGVRFTGAVPTSLRLREADAGELEGG